MNADIKLAKNCQIIIGTPGRVTFMINKNLIKFTHLKLIMFDDIDDILNREFLDSIKEILSTINFSQFIFFSNINNTCNTNQNTNNSETNSIEVLFDKYIKNIKQVIVKEEALTFDKSKQFIVNTKKEWKIEMLINLYKTIEISQSIIYCNTIKTAENINKILLEKEYAVNFINEEYAQAEKEKIFEDFKNGNLRILILTCSSGILINDYNDVSLIINFDFPSKKENYIKRVGKLDFINQKTNSISFVTLEDKEVLRDVQNNYNLTLLELPNELSAIR